MSAKYTSSQLSIQYRIAMAGPLASRLPGGLTEFGYSFLTSCTKVLPNVKTNIRSIEGGRDSHDFASPVDDCRRLIVQRLVQALVVVKCKIATQAVD